MACYTIQAGQYPPWQNAVKTPRLVGVVDSQEQFIEEQADGIDVEGVTDHAATSVVSFIQRQLGGSDCLTHSQPESP